jgi:hypothetical protein
MDTIRTDNNSAATISTNQQNFSVWIASLYSVDDAGLQVEQIGDRVDFGLFDS